MFNKNAIYILTILEAIEKIKLYTNGFVRADDLFFANDQINFNATVNLLIAIGEESKKIDVELKQKYDNIFWKGMARLRDKISHDYRGIDPNIVWNMIEIEIPKMKSSFINIIQEEKVSKTLIEDAVNTEYYKHLRYLIS